MEQNGSPSAQVKDKEVQEATETLLELVSCPVTGCEGRDFNGSHGLAVHFGKKHKDLKPKVQISEPRHATKDGIKCPACYIYCNGQQDLNDHFAETHEASQHAKHSPSVEQIRNSSMEQSGNPSAQVRDEDVQEATETLLQLVSCPVTGCGCRDFNGSHGLAVHFGKKHKDLKPKVQISEPRDATKDGIKCPACYVYCNGQQDLNDHFTETHEASQHAKHSTHTPVVKKSSDSHSQPEPIKTTELECVNCPVPGCKKDQLQGSSGLAIHFSEEHTDYLSGDRPQTTDTLRSPNSVRCPVCYTEHAGQGGFNKHFESAHPRGSLVNADVESYQRGPPPCYSALFETEATNTTLVTKTYKEMNEKLLQLTKEVRPNQDDSREQSKKINDVKDAISNELVRQSETARLKWMKPEGTGSSYDKTKIGDPDEYDTIFQCKINCRCEYEADYIMKVTKVPSFPEITVSLKESCQVPTVKMKLDDCSIDLVPAIQIKGWPEGCSEWTPRWISGFEKTRLKESYNVVARIHPTEYTTPPGQCKLWEMSFSCTEKKILLHADGTFSSLTKPTCRKKLIVLLKFDLQELNNGRKHKLKDFNSYCLKTTALNLFDIHPDALEWTEDKLLARYNDALAYIIKSLRKKELYHYVNNLYNLLQKMKNPPNIQEKEDTEAERQYVINYFQRKQQELRDTNELSPSDNFTSRI